MAITKSKSVGAVLFATGLLLGVVAPSTTAQTVGMPATQPAMAGGSSYVPGEYRQTPAYPESYYGRPFYPATEVQAL